MKRKLYSQSDYTVYNYSRRELLARAEAAEKRVKELEAKLAALEHAACPNCQQTLNLKLLLPF